MKENVVGVNAVLYVDGKPVGVVKQMSLSYRKPQNGRMEIEFVAEGVIRQDITPMPLFFTPPDDMVPATERNVFRKMRFEDQE